MPISYQRLPSPSTPGILLLSWAAVIMNITKGPVTKVRHNVNYVRCERFGIQEQRVLLDAPDFDQSGDDCIRSGLAPLTIIFCFISPRHKVIRFLMGNLSLLCNNQRGKMKQSHAAVTRTQNAGSALVYWTSQHLKMCFISVYMSLQHDCKVKCRLRHCSGVILQANFTGPWDKASHWSLREKHHYGLSFISAVLGQFKPTQRTLSGSITEAMMDGKAWMVHWLSEPTQKMSVKPVITFLREHLRRKHSTRQSLGSLTKLQGRV